MNLPARALAWGAVLLLGSLLPVHATDLRPAPVGFTSLEYRDAERDRPLQVRVWYPAADGTPEAPISYEHAFKGHAAAEAAYRASAAPRPLVVMSHGDKGSNLDQSWLAETLAANGYVVAAVAHWLNTWNRNEPEATVSVWERPKDMSVVADRLLADPVWGARLDARRIAAAGHSSGGYAALALAGAEYLPMQMAGYCSSPQRGPDCALAAGVKLGTVDFSKASLSYRDARFRAVVAMAPALGPGIDVASLRSVAIPVAVVTARDDEVLPGDQHARRYAAGIPGARLVELPQGGHFGFMPECTLVTKAFTFFRSFDVCGRRSDVDRPAVHARVAREALAFLAASLPAAEPVSAARNR